MEEVMNEADRSADENALPLHRRAWRFRQPDTSVPPQQDALSDGNACTEQLLRICLHVGSGYHSTLFTAFPPLPVMINNLPALATHPECHHLIIILQFRCKGAELTDPAIPHSGPNFGN